jgi:thiol-disulfide isomerase/thioredoxin
MKQSIKISLMIVAASLAMTSLAGCGRDVPASSQIGTTVIAPDDRVKLEGIEGVTSDGEEIALADFSGRVVVLNGWATWCAPCREEMPDLVVADESFDDTLVGFLGVNISDDLQAAADFAMEFGVSYPSIVDEDGSIWAQIPDIPPNALPSTVIVDKQGRVAVRIIGKVDPLTLPGLIQDVVKE